MDEQTHTRRMREFRKEKNLSTAKASARADMEPATWNRIETGKVSPNLKSLKSIARALEVPTSALLEEQPHPLAQSPLWPADLSPEDRAVIETIEGLNERLSALLLLNGKPEMWTIASTMVHDVGRLIPALMKNKALAEELRPLVARTSELGRELLNGLRNAARNVDTIPPETKVGLEILEGDVISLERYRKAS